MTIIFYQKQPDTYLGEFLELLENYFIGSLQEKSSCSIEEDFSTIGEDPIFCGQKLGLLLENPATYRRVWKPGLINDIIRLFIFQCLVFYGKRSRLPQENNWPSIGKFQGVPGLQLEMIWSSFGKDLLSYVREPGVLCSTLGLYWQKLVVYLSPGPELELLRKQEMR